MRRWSAGARWRDARDAADRDRARLRRMFTNRDPIEVQAEPVEVMGRSVWEGLTAQLDAINWEPIQVAAEAAALREADYRESLYAMVMTRIREESGYGFTYHADMSQSIGGTHHTLTWGDVSQVVETYHTVNRRHEPEVVETPWDPGYGPVVSWPDEGYPCQVCWAVGRWPWEPLRATPVGVDPDDYACEAHCTRCEVPRHCARHRRSVERRVRVAAADAPRPSPRGRPRINWTRGSAYVTPRHIPGWRCCPEQEIVESVRFQEQYYTRYRCGSCGSTWHVSDEYLAAVE